MVSFRLVKMKTAHFLCPFKTKKCPKNWTLPSFFRLVPKGVTFLSFSSYLKSPSSDSSSIFAASYTKMLIVNTEKYLSDKPKSAFLRK